MIVKNDSKVWQEWATYLLWSLAASCSLQVLALIPNDTALLKWVPYSCICQAWQLCADRGNHTLMPIQPSSWKLLRCLSTPKQTQRKDLPDPHWRFCQNWSNCLGIHHNSLFKPVSKNTLNVSFSGITQRHQYAHIIDPSQVSKMRQLNPRMAMNPKFRWSPF